MRRSSLIKITKISIVFIVIAVVSFIYFSQRGEKIDEKLAGIICAKLINDYVDSNFIIKKVSFNESYKFNQVKVDLSIAYNNGKETSSMCYYKKRYGNSTISLIKADLRDSSGKLKTFSDLKVIYKN
ncbi:MAG: hypothetical protein FWE18_04810 [Alphaproteobacteria bacterium]|nr:hypothetical protein [Alphaproteobacteria bacterium]